MSGLRFVQPAHLLVLLVVLAAAAAYVWQQRRGRSTALRFSDSDLLASVAPRFPSWRKHLTAALLLVSLTGVSAAWAKPQATVTTHNRATVVVAMDVSSSMSLTDVSPSRFVAATAAAADFVNKLPEGISVGLVSFATKANLVVAPTQDHTAVATALTTLKMTGGTAIGDAVSVSLAAVKSAAAAGEVPRIVLLSDGATTTGLSVNDAAAAAADAKVPVTTIGYGTDGVTADQNGQSVAVPVDKTALKDLASTTGGTYYDASSGKELTAVYADIKQTVGVRTERHEISAAVMGLALAAGMAAAAASLAWGTRLL